MKLCPYGVKPTKTSLLSHHKFVKFQNVQPIDIITNISVISRVCNTTSNVWNNSWRHEIHDTTDVTFPIVTLHF